VRSPRPPFISPDTGIEISKRAFTLVELLLVLVLVAMISAISFPSFVHNYEQFQLKETANSLSSLMRYAQGRAVALGREHRLEFSPDYATYRMAVRAADPDDPAEKNFTKVPGKFGRTYGIPPGIRAEASSQNIHFNESGQMDDAVIYLCRKERCVILSTQEQSGYVRMYDGKME